MDQTALPKTSTPDKISHKATEILNGKTTPVQNKQPEAPESTAVTKMAAATTEPARQTEDGFEAWLKRNQREFSLVLPKHISVDRIMRLALSAVRRNPSLLSCSLSSIAGGIMEATALGLEINSPLHQAVLVPFNNRKTGTKDAQIIIEYRGYIDLFYRTGKVLTVYAKEVYENDTFDIRYGINETLDHIPWYLTGKKESGQIIGFYAYAKMTEGAYRFEYLPVSEINKIRDEYASGYDEKDPNCPWVHDYIAMGKKTLIRRLEPFLPKSAEIRYAAETDYSIIDPMKIEIPPAPTLETAAAETKK